MQEQEKKTNKKLIAMILIFTLTFGNFAFVGKWSYAAGLDFFKSDEYSMNAYFANVSSSDKLNIKQDVNETAKMCIDIGISGDGYIKEGMLEITAKNGLSKLGYTVEGVFEEYKPENEQNSNNNMSQNTVANVVSNTTSNNAVSNNVVENVVSNTASNNVVSNNVVENVATNTASNNAVSNNVVENAVTNTTSNNVVSNNIVTNNTTNTTLNETTINTQSTISAGQTANKKAFENNKLKLDQINGSTKMYLNLKYNNEEYAYSSEGDTLKFTGIYVDKDLKEHYVEKTVDYTINWTSKQDVEITNELTKYIPYNIGEKSGVIVQEKIKVNKTNAQNSILIPTKKTTIETNIPTIKGTMPSTVDVVAVSIKGTTGKEVTQMQDTDFSWEYKNNTQTVVIQTNNDLTKEKAWAGAGYDEYVVIYQYDMNIDSVMEEERYIENKIKIENALCNGEETQKEISNKVYLTGKVGEIVSLNSESISKTVNKGKMLANYNVEIPYETEIKSKVEVNIASNELVNQIALRNTEANFITSSGEVLATDAMYYKELMITKENLLSLVGEEGYIEILSEDGQSLCKLTSNIETNENGEYIVKFEDEIKRIWIQTTQVTGAGILGINITKGIKTNEYEKAVIRDLTAVQEKVEIYAKYLEKEEAEKISEQIIETKLENTKTEATIELSSKDIPTSSMVENLEMRVKLNNNKETSDMYENGTFLIVFPKEIKEVQVNNVGILYGDEFKFKSADQIDMGGQTAIRLEVEGRQNGFNTVDVANGTNLVLNINLKADVYAPNVKDRIQLYYMNGDVTTYATQTEMNGGTVGYDEEELNIVSGNGLVNITTLTGYEQDKEQIAIRGEKKVAEIGAYEEQKTAEMKVTLINNKDEAVQNVKVLGRIPFENNKNILTKEDLGSTFTANMENGITLDGVQSENVKVYYSENEEATEDVANGLNGWTTEVQDFSKVKSYLISLDNETLQSKEVMDFKYNINIPENLEYDEKAFSTYKLFYSVGGSSLEEGYTTMSLATPEGPNLEIEMTATPGEKAYIGDTVTYNINVKNTGETALTNVNVNAIVPDGTTYTEADVDLENETFGYKYDEEKKVADFHIDKLEAEQEVTFSYMVTTESESLIGKNIEAYATVTTDEFPHGENSEVISLKCEKAMLYINSIMPYYNDVVFTKNDLFRYKIRVRNISNNILNNVIITNTMPDGFIYDTSSAQMMTEDYTTSNNSYDIEYDKENKYLKIRIDKLNIGEEIEINVKGNITDTIKETSIIFTTNVVAEGTDVYNSNDIKIPIANAIITAKESSNIDTTYVNKGDIIEYYAIIENSGEYVSNFLDVSKLIPDELEIQEARYYVINSNDEVEEEDVMIVRDNLCTKSILIPEKKKALIKIITKVKENLENKEEIEISVNTVIEDENDENYRLESNSVKHIIKGEKTTEPTVEPIQTENPTVNATEPPINTPDNMPTENPKQTPFIEPTQVPEETPSVTVNPTPTINPTSIPTQNINNNNDVTTYKIIGSAWLDENKDGIKDSNEKVLSEIPVRVINVQTNSFEKDTNGNDITTTTKSDGTYSLERIKAGRYIVVFEYDTENYSVTKYKESNVAENKNSNVTTNKIQIDGKQKTVAVSDVIQITNENIGDIDIGLIKNSILDFKIEKTVKKITVTTNKGTETNDYNNAILAKAEIHAKEMNGAKVIIDYEIKISNIGEVAGTIGEIIDYIPSGTELSSTSLWTIRNNQAVNMSLKNEVLQAGETKTLNISVTKNMTEDNTGVVENRAKLSNVNAVSNTEKIVINDTEEAKANVIITVKTGIKPMYILVTILVSLIIIGIGIKIYKIKKC